jgi:RNA polymerase sigma-70 factor, ECF subfamily
MVDDNARDRNLIERLRARDHSAVADLESRYAARIRQLALRCVRNEEDADEVVQDVLFKVYQKIEAFRGDAALSSWIYRITFNTAMSRLRASRATHGEVELANVTPAGSDGVQTPDVADWSSLGDDEVLRGELRQKLRKALAMLPPIYRVPVLLRDVHGLTTEEASAALKVKDQTLKSRLHRGRMILREELSDFAGGLSLHRESFESRN